MDTQNSENTSNFKNLLRSNIVEVNFTKRDGSHRKMKCTLQENLLPTKSEETKAYTVSDKLIRVWDIEAAGWRSFAFEQIIDYRVL